MKKNLMYILGALAVIYVIVVVLLYVFIGKIVFLPTKLPAEYGFKFDHAFEEIDLQDLENEMYVNGLFFPAWGRAKGIVLYMHGNADDLQRWGEYTIDFTSNHYDVFAIDYPGYGKTKGKTTESSIYQSAEMAYDWVRNRYDPANIIIYGRSMGCGPASYLASRYPAEKLLLETPFYSLHDVLKIRYPYVFFFPPKYTFPVNEYLRQVSCETFIFQGTTDEVVPYESAVKLRPLLGSEEHFIVITGGKHKNLREFPEYHTELKKILGQ